MKDPVNGPSLPTGRIKTKFFQWLIFCSSGDQCPTWRSTYIYIPKETGARHFLEGKN